MYMYAPWRVCTCLLILPRHTHAHTHGLCVCSCSIGAPVAEIRSERVLSFFTGNFSRRGVSPRLFFDCYGFLTTASRLLVADKPQVVKPALNPIPCHRARLLSETRDAQPERTQKVSTGEKDNSHTYQSDSWVFCAMTDIWFCFHTT